MGEAERKQRGQNEGKKILKRKIRKTTKKALRIHGREGGQSKSTTA